MSRDDVIAQLQDHFAEGRLEVADFEARVERAEAAASERDLALVLHGLPARAIERPGRVTTTVKAVFGGISRRGAWRATGAMEVSARFGEVELDFTQAVLPAGPIDVVVSAVFGTVHVIVPDDLQVEVEGAATFGRFDHLEQPAASRRDPRVVRIRGRALFGTVVIEVRRRPGLMGRLKGLLGP